MGGGVFLAEAEGAVVARVADSVSDSAAVGAAAVVEGLGRNRPLKIHPKTANNDSELPLILISSDK